MNCPSKFKLPEFRINPRHISAHTLSEYLRISRARFSLRTATSLMPTDAIGGLQIGFTTVEAGDFPNGLRCNRQILYIRVCHSAHHQISSFAAHGETGLIKLLFPRIHVLHVNEKAVFISTRGKVFQSISSLPFQPPPPTHPLLRLQSTPNKCGHSGRLVVYFVSNLLPSWQLTWHIINSYKDESAIRTLCLWIGCEVARPPLAFLAPPRMNYSRRVREGASLWDVTRSTDNILFRQRCQG